MAVTPIVPLDFRGGGGAEVKRRNTRNTLTVGAPKEQQTPGPQKGPSQLLIER